MILNLRGKKKPGKVLYITVVLIIGHLNKKVFNDDIRCKNRFNIIRNPHTLACLIFSYVFTKKKLIEIFPMGKQEIDNSVQRAEKQNKMNANLRERNVTVSLMMFYLADEQNIHFKSIYHKPYLVNTGLSHR